MLEATGKAGNWIRRVGPALGDFRRWAELFRPETVGLPAQELPDGNSGVSRQLPWDIPRVRGPLG